MRRFCFYAHKVILQQVFTFFLLLLLFSGCASSNKQKYDDWKYMGFGKEIPEWFEFALKKNFGQLQKLIPEVHSRKDIIILKSSGKNLDQAENKNHELEESISDDFEFYDEFWTRFSNESKEPFVSIILYIRKQ